MSAKKIKRREAIVEFTHHQGSVSVDELAARLDVSAQTIRRDINDLCELNVLRRRHGGAELFEKQLNMPYDLRATTNSRAKRAVAQAAAEMITDGSTVFLSIGSTPMEVAQALRTKKHLTLITNNLNAAMALSHETTNRIILPGGELRLPDRDFLGSDVVDMFRSYRAEFGIFGVAGVAEDGALLDFHATEVAVRETIKEASTTSILVLDHTKFGRLAPAVGGNIANVDRVISDTAPEAGYLPALEALGDRFVTSGANA